MKEDYKKDLNITLKLWAERRNELRRFQCRQGTERMVTNLSPVILSGEERNETSEYIAFVENEAYEIVKHLEAQASYRQSIKVLVKSLQEKDPYGEGTVARIMKEKREAELTSFREKVTSKENDLESGWVVV